MGNDQGVSASLGQRGRRPRQAGSKIEGGTRHRVAHGALASHAAAARARQDVEPPLDVARARSGPDVVEKGGPAGTHRVQHLLQRDERRRRHVVTQHGVFERRFDGGIGHRDANGWRRMDWRFQ